MVFNTPIFFVFFLVFLLFYGLVFVQKTPRVYFILVASLVFYGAWNYRFIPLLVGSSVVDYYLALAIAGAATLQRKKLLLTLLFESDRERRSRFLANSSRNWFHIQKTSLYFCG